MKKYIDVVNLHLTESCNFKCSYCFAKFNNDNELKLDSWKKVVDNIASYFNSKNIMGRINLAGGEPMILPFLDDLIDYILSKDIKVSIITNGYYLNKKKIDSWKNKLTMIGVSVDSIDETTNIKIGRCTKSKKTIDYTNFIDTLNYIKKQDMILKVNTVISKINYHQDITELYNKVDFDRIKLLQLRVNKGSNDEAQKDAITKQEFEMYCNKVINTVNKRIICESSDEIENSYVFIDPEGFLISNDSDSHNSVGNVLNEKLELLIEKANVNINKFNLRYQGTDI